MPYIRTIYKIAAVITVLFFLKSEFVFALEDGFGSSKKIEGRNIVVYYDTQFDVSELTRLLNMGASDKLLISRPIDTAAFSPEQELVDMLDTLFIQVCDILDMDVYSLKLNIKICRDAEHIKKIYTNLFDGTLDRESFYVYSINTIYVSREHFKREIIGHEIGHAVINNYFVVTPSIKIQELLAAYVEFQLRKY